MTLIALTGPTGFQSQVHFAIENVLEANFVNLNHKSEANIKFWLEQADGVILPGGADLHPSSYGGDVLYHHNLTRFSKERDDLEETVIDFCLEEDVPLLGICRGHQRMAAYAGLPIIQDLFTGKIAHMPGKDMDIPPEQAAHRIRYMTGAKGYAYVNSFHHQAVHALDVSRSEHLVPLASSSDQVCEMMEFKNRRAFSVQWHPECDYSVNPASMEVWERFKRWLDGGAV